MSHNYVSVVALNQLLEAAADEDQLRQELRQLTCDPGCSSSDCSAAQWWSVAGRRFETIQKVLPYIFCFPNSNAATERSFSILKAVHTPVRNSLALDTINSILHIKLNKHSESHTVDDKETLLKSCKKATRAYNEAHGSYR